MTDPSDQFVGRRTFFKGMLRKAALAAMGVGAGAAAIKRTALRREHKCINRGVCRGCAAFGRCRLPQAMSAKEAMATEAPHRDRAR